MGINRSAGILTIFAVMCAAISFAAYRPSIGLITATSLYLISLVRLWPSSSPPQHGMCLRCQHFTVSFILVHRSYSWLHAMIRDRVIKRMAEEILAFLSGGWETAGAASTGAGLKKCLWCLRALRKPLVFSSTLHLVVLRLCHVCCSGLAHAPYSRHALSGRCCGILGLRRGALRWCWVVREDATKLGSYLTIKHIEYMNIMVIDWLGSIVGVAYLTELLLTVLRSWVGSNTRSCWADARSAVWSYCLGMNMGHDDTG